MPATAAGVFPPAPRPCRRFQGDTVTLTNHVQNIELLAGSVLAHADAREYELAHVALDDIEKKVQAIRRHIDHLQNVTDFCARPAGEDVT